MPLTARTTPQIKRPRPPTNAPVPTIPATVVNGDRPVSFTQTVVLQSPAVDVDTVEADAVRRGVAEVDRVTEHGARRDRFVDDARRTERQHDFDPHSLRVAGHQRLDDDLGFGIELERIIRSVALDQGSIDRDRARHLGRRG